MKMYHHICKMTAMKKRAMGHVEIVLPLCFSQESRKRFKIKCLWNMSLAFQYIFLIHLFWLRYDFSLTHIDWNMRRKHIIQIYASMLWEPLLKSPPLLSAFLCFTQTLPGLLLTLPFKRILFTNVKDCNFSLMRFKILCRIFTWLISYHINYLL